MASLYVGFVTLLLAGPAIVLFLGLIRQRGVRRNDAPRARRGPEPAPATGPGRASRCSASRRSSPSSASGPRSRSRARSSRRRSSAGSRPAAGSGSAAHCGVSRRVFWSIAVAAFLVGFLENLVSNRHGHRSPTPMTSASDASTVIGIVVAGLVIMPFAYHQSGIILGGVGAIEALRRSTRLARARWRLAFLVALAGTRPELHRDLRARSRPRRRVPRRRRLGPDARRIAARRDR